MGADGDAVEGAVVFPAAVVGALGDAALDAPVCGICNTGRLLSFLIQEKYAPDKKG